MSEKIEPLQLAIDYAKELKDSFYWQQDLYQYTGTHYQLVNEVRLKLHRFAIDKGSGVSNAFVSTAESQLYSLKMIEVDEIPCWIGEDKGEVIPFKNGLLHVDSGELLPHTPDYLCTFCLPYDYSEEGDCPEWKKFLSEIFDGDEEKILLLQQWFGYCLMSDCRFEKFLLKIGPTRSGKGTTDKVLQAVIGDNACVGYSLSQLGSQFGLLGLVGKRVALIGEVHLGKSAERTNILEKLKSIVGGDVQNINRKFKEPISKSFF